MFIEQAPETRRWLELSSRRLDFTAARRSLDAFGEPLRRRIMEGVAGAPHNSTRLAMRIPGSKVADVRQRMRALFCDGLVSTQRFDMVRLNSGPVKACASYIDLMVTLSSRSCLFIEESMDLDAVLFALSDKKRRGLFELIVIRPDGISALADRSRDLRQNVSYHANALLNAGLIVRSGEKFYPVASCLPELRMYFERLWLEAELGDAWLSRRKIEASDHGI